MVSSEHSKLCQRKERSSTVDMLPVIAGGQGINREISLDLKHGIEAKNYDDVRNPIIKSQSNMSIKY